MPAARAASNESTPNMSVMKVTSRVVFLRIESLSVSAGTERAHSTAMSMSMSEAGGRSDRSTGGRELEEMVGGREARKARCVVDEVEAKVYSVAVTPCREARRFASSAIGIRCPIPGVASSATCGGCRTDSVDTAPLLILISHGVSGRTRSLTVVLGPGIGRCSVKSEWAFSFYKQFGSRSMPWMLLKA